MWLIDDDGDETTVNATQLRKIARRNGIDEPTFSICEIIDCLMDCFENLTITKVGPYPLA